ncbi:MAG: VIT1/CCC1 transporter family protein [Myxococcaceae bacterium]|nr:VIT1/CCC1 transporter family protein [Myxococcaceae bacterium]
MKTVTEQDYHDRVDPHRQGARSAEIILGAQDGLVNVLGVVLGVAAATSNGAIVLAAGAAAAIAESASMAAVAFTSSRAQAHYYDAEVARERRHVQHSASIEREEVRALYAAKGFSGELLERIVAHITKDPEVWVALMMAEEHQLAPVPLRRSLAAAVIVGVASLVGSLIPLGPFLVLDGRAAVVGAVAVAALALFALGAVKARNTVGSTLREGLTLMAIGLVTSALAWAVGLWLEVK